MTRTLGLCALLGVVIGACEGPADLRPVPIDGQESLAVILVLDADSAVQDLLVGTVFPGDTLTGIAAQLAPAGGGPIALTAAEDRCTRAYLVSPSGGVCLSTAEPLLTGVRYTLWVSADGRPSAEAEAIVPGPFSIEDVQVTGTPPGAEHVAASWTPAEGAYGYLVSLRSAVERCTHVNGCQAGWTVMIRETSVDAPVTAGSLDEGLGPWDLVVTALDEALFRYLASGTSGDLFSLPPAENIEGGYGIVGGMTVRSWDLP